MALPRRMTSDSTNLSWKEARTTFSTPDFSRRRFYHGLRRGATVKGRGYSIDGRPTLCGQMAAHATSAVPRAHPWRPAGTRVPTVNFPIDTEPGNSVTSEALIDAGRVREPLSALWCRSNAVHRPGVTLLFWRATDDSHRRRRVKEGCVSGMAATGRR
ncbi:hypothetical protein MTO96_008034 [Rhipicephalus appendiculatus]